ncbi:hypothetical protein CCH79_00009235 [Gambusia affinis]|uniref:Uncharacterized protein n=1 Tax=Gambusia affinis TaxID=33528 RepID=A0A315W6Y5_GAMAF|nr:hypothetical protein CCH79_00009235 [Gambusia affinis]
MNEKTGGRTAGLKESTLNLSVDNREHQVCLIYPESAVLGPLVALNPNNLLQAFTGVASCKLSQKRRSLPKTNRGNKIKNMVTHSNAK